jgi:hypothetical protein
MFDETPILARLVRCSIVPVIFFQSFLTAAVWGAEDPIGSAGEVKLASGRTVSYTVHFDRNSLRDSCRVGDGLIALTSSGTLLRFELPAIKLVGERIGADEVTCIGRGEADAVLAGLADGRICRVDPVSLELTDFARLPSAPHWIGWRAAAAKRAAGLLALTTQSKNVEEDGRRFSVPVSAVHDLAKHTALVLEQQATTYLLDRTGWLWLGADKGEWGGWVARVDTSNGSVVEIKPPPDPKPNAENSWDGVYGFVERADGQVLAFGGTSHMGMNSAFITRVDQPDPRRLLTIDPPENPDVQLDTNRPSMPITHVIEEDGRLLVLSYSDVFRAESAFASWKRVATLDIGYRWGRPDAVGAYPSVCTVHPPRHKGEGYLFATVGDGYVSLDGAKATAHGIPGQLGASSVDEIKNTSAGTFFFDDDDRLPFWRRGAQGWDIAALAPPFEPDPANELADFEKSESKDWYQTRVLASPTGMIYTVSGTGISDGTRTTARLVDGKPERIGRETSSLNPSDCFLTADGTLWNSAHGQVKRFEKGRWQTVAQFAPDECPSGSMKPLNQNGPPWLLLDSYLHNLWQLHHGAAGDKPRFESLDVRDRGKSLRVEDAIPWPKGGFLLATDAGLRAFDPTGPRLSRVDLPEPTKPATELIADGRGRLWLGSHDGGLWLIDPAAKAIESLDRVPFVGQSDVYGLAPDSHHEDGVIVALGSRGVAFVRAGQRP